MLLTAERGAPVSYTHLDPITPATLGPIACISRKFPGSVSYTHLPPFLFWGLFFTIYFIMRAVNCLQDSIYRSYRMKSKRSLLQQQIRTLLATLLLLFTVFAALLLLLSLIHI